MTQKKTEDHPVRVVLVDDHLQMHKIVQATLGATTDIKLVGQGANGEEGITLCEQYQPDIALMDVVMPVLDGIEATKILHERFPAIKILVLSSFHDHESVYAMLRNGAVGYLTKDSLAQDLAETIRATFQGKMVFSSEVGAQLVSPPQPAALVTEYNRPHASTYADACHLFYEARSALRPRFPELLAPDQMYGVMK